MSYRAAVLEAIVILASGLFATGLSVALCIVAAHWAAWRFPADRVLCGRCGKTQVAR